MEAGEAITWLIVGARLGAGRVIEIGSETAALPAASRAFAVSIWAPWGAVEESHSHENVSPDFRVTASAQTRVSET